MTELIQRHKSLKEAARLATEEASTNKELVESILSQVVVDTMKRYQVKLGIGVQDSISDLLDNFKQRVTESVFSTGDAWRSTTGQEPFLYPKGCRFCYTRGETTIVVIEEDPKLRSLSFDYNMVGTRGETRPQERVTLALPYVVFLALFRRGEFAGLYSGWRTKPLYSLNDLLCKPLLPNMHNNLQVCLGRVTVTGNVAVATEKAITDFWNSRFNTDLSESWWEKSNVCSTVATAEMWAASTEGDPLFILNLPLERTLGARTVQNLLNLLSSEEETPDQSQFRHRLSEEIDGCVGTLFQKLTGYFKKNKYEKHFPKDISESLAKHMKEVVAELSDVIYTLEAEIKGFSQDLHQEDSRMESRSDIWTKYYS